MAITLGQHYNVGENDKTLGQQHGVGEKDARKAETEAAIVLINGWQDNNVLTFLKSRCVLTFHHATPIGNFIHYCSVRVSLVRVRFIDSRTSPRPMLLLLLSSHMLFA